MHIGTQLITLETGAKSYYTPWLPKGADNAYFTYEIISQFLATGGSPGFTVTAYTKNREDAGSEGTSFSFSQIGSTAFYHAECTNLKQLVRFKITITPGTDVTIYAQGVTYRFLPPTWYDKAV
ncbi:MAG: hypothetical protein ACK58T_00805 [Phycisphaerae bacterium]|jgi:hypothetical protein